MIGSRQVVPVVVLLPGVDINTFLAIYTSKISNSLLFRLQELGVKLHLVESFFLTGSVAPKGVFFISRHNLVVR